MLLKNYILKGHYVAFKAGHFIIFPRKGQQMPADWLNNNRSRLMGEISDLFGISVLEYQDYQTNHYGKHKFSGVCLRYVDVQTDMDRVVFFNAELTRVRSTKYGKQGAALPKRRFRCLPRSGFAKFWRMLEVTPSRPKEYYDYMGKLKSIYITGEVDGNKVINKTIRPVDITYEAICERLGCIPVCGDLQTPANPSADIAKGTSDAQMMHSEYWRGSRASLNASFEEYEIYEQRR